jgi:excisionase family DNA binding protein
MDMATIKLKWHTTAEVVRILGFSLSKTKMLVTCGEIRPLKAGRNRQIMPEWVDEYVQRLAQQAEDGWSFSR